MVCASVREDNPRASAMISIICAIGILQEKGTQHQFSFDFKDTKYCHFTLPAVGLNLQLTLVNMAKNALTYGWRRLHLYPSKPLKACIKTEFHDDVRIFYWNYSFNELAHSKITNSEIPSPFMTFNDSYRLAKTQKSDTTMLSRSLIPLNEVHVFDK